MKGTNAELTFENLDFNNYYPTSAHNYDGYQGFNFADMGLLTRNAITFLGYGNFTGYSAALDGTTEAFTYVNRFGHGGGSGLGEITSIAKHETFNLESGTFASAWDSKQPTYFEALDAKGHVTATLYVTLGQTAQTVNFANYGTEFQNISGLKIISEKGTPGKYGLTGYQIAMDDIYVHWNGPIPHARLPHSPPHHHAAAVAAMSGQHGGWFDHFDVRSSAAPTTQDYGGHDAALHGGDHQGDGLHSGFLMPPVEHHLGP